MAETGARKKITIGLLILVVAIIIWQGMDLLGGGTYSVPASKPVASAGNTKIAKQNTALRPVQGNPVSLPQAHLSPNTAQTNAELVKMQHDTQEKYLAALNELQVLKVNRDIALTNQAIMAARLAAVTAEKKMTDIVSPPEPTPQEYAQNLVTPQTTQAQTAPTTSEQEPDYTVVSVSLLQNQWSAVMGLKGNLYSVRVGDVLPADESKVIAIDKYGVTLMKDGEKHKISMVPII